MSPTPPSPPPAAHNISAQINYWQPRADGTLPTKTDFLPIMRQCHENDPRELTIHDIRAANEDFCLDRNGFEVVVLPQSMPYTKVEEEIREVQYPVLEEVIRALTGGSRVHVFNHIIRDATHQELLQRQQNPDFAAPSSTSDLTGNTPASRGPSLRPHVDFDGESCPAFFAQTRPLLRNYINSGRRWQIIGIWRPLKTVYRDPFVLLDARTTRDEDFVRMERVDDGKRGGNGRVRVGRERPRVAAEEVVPPAGSIVKYGGGHHWYYIHEQQPHEMWVFKHFDSLKGGAEGGGAWRCAHTSVKVPGTMGHPYRESIEFRALVLY